MHITEFDEKFDRVLNELQRDREEQARKWDEQNRKLDAFQAEQNRNRVVDRKIVISPMVDERAIPVAKSLGIETYSYADMVVS
ncbi:hypothetical protein [Cylindrospermopsis sp. CR12]|uniref:hypothetical protein n=1 Tax=Cylindrospermopsis sp. CR12 TaxID=1747196 RepID=UPI00070FF501|nr:hypothetical protein [Cylindrospermopsis sp. CR12]KRH95659.1 hypothetical protein ASL19_10765 [Cylindrospermopsis sp. CR12]